MRFQLSHGLLGAGTGVKEEAEHMARAELGMDVVGSITLHQSKFFMKPCQCVKAKWLP